MKFTVINQHFGESIFSNLELTYKLAQSCSGWSTLLTVGKAGFISQAESYQKTYKKMVFTAFLLGTQHKKDSVEDKPASLLAYCVLGQDIHRDASICV